MIELGIPLKLSQEEHDLQVLRHRLTWINTPEGKIYSQNHVVTWKLDPSVAYSIEETLSLITRALDTNVPCQARKTLVQLERKVRATMDIAQSLERERRGRLVK